MAGAPVTVGCGAICGVDAIPVTIEVTMRGVAEGGPKILGLVDTVVREAYHRVLCAYRASEVPTPRGSATINFIPADLRKHGSGFDLPMALGLAGASGQVPRAAFFDLAALGEISLEGRVLPARGIVAITLAARSKGWTRLLTSPQDAPMAALVPGVQVFAVRSLAEALAFLRGGITLSPSPPRPLQSAPEPLELADIRGHETPKSALVVAAAGRHNLLLVGPPGSGKSALARRLPGLMPRLGMKESLEVLKIHTIAGTRSPGSPRMRPMRAPHHTSSHVSLLGGGPDPRPGEVTLAQHGVLFLDELAEFRREALEGLRQPLEDGSITIGRALRTVTMPADFLLVAAMNPCPCGFLGHPSRPCSCQPGQLQRYRGRVSGPLLDRLDLQVEVPALDPRCFREPVDPAWSTASLRERVEIAMLRQQSRNRIGDDFLPNGRLADRMLARAVGTNDAVLSTLDEVLEIHHLSGRARVRLLRIARTLADLEDREAVRPEDMLQAARLRGCGGLLSA